MGVIVHKSDFDLWALKAHQTGALFTNKLSGGHHRKIGNRATRMWVVFFKPGEVLRNPGAQPTPVAEEPVTSRPG
jgi:hypothetical protein